MLDNIHQERFTRQNCKMNKQNKASELLGDSQA